MIPAKRVQRRMSFFCLGAWFRAVMARPHMNCASRNGVSVVSLWPLGPSVCVRRLAAKLAYVLTLVVVVDAPMRPRRATAGHTVYLFWSCTQTPSTLLFGYVILLKRLIRNVNILFEKYAKKSINILTVCTIFN